MEFGWCGFIGVRRAYALRRCDESRADRERNLVRVAGVRISLEMAWFVRWGSMMRSRRRTAGVRLVGGIRHTADKRSGGHRQVQACRRTEHTRAQACRLAGVQAQRRAGVQAHRVTGVQAYKRTDVQAYSRTDVLAHRRAGIPRPYGVQAYRRTGAQA